MKWRDALLHLHVSGWNADDIDDACEAVHQACDEGEYQGVSVRDLSVTQLASILHVTVDDKVLTALRAIAALRDRQGADAEELQRALYDLDAFAYDFAGGD